MAAGTNKINGATGTSNKSLPSASLPEGAVRPDYLPLLVFIHKHYWISVRQADERPQHSNAWYQAGSTYLVTSSVILQNEWFCLDYRGESSQQMDIPISDYPHRVLHEIDRYLNRRLDSET